MAEGWDAIKMKVGASLAEDRRRREGWLSQAIVSEHAQVDLRRERVPLARKARSIYRTTGVVAPLPLPTTPPAPLRQRGPRDPNRPC